MLISSLFIHGGLFHLLGNMLYLWVFGGSIESRFGYLRFLLFYIMTGIFATLVHCYFYIDSTIPLIGASGAIAGILGADGRRSITKCRPASPGGRTQAVLPRAPFS